MGKHRRTFALSGAFLLFLSYGAAQNTTSPTLTNLHVFFSTFADGCCPESATLGPDGVLYGTTLDYATAWALAPPASPGGPWTETVLHTFCGAFDGCYPNGDLAIGAGGVLYGTTQQGGSVAGAMGCVYSLTPPASPGGAWTETVIYTFMGREDGQTPSAVVIGDGGVLYGVTFGGPSGGGTVFSLRPPSTPGGAWTKRRLYGFAGVPDGAIPYARLVIGAGGVLYGATQWGGTHNLGTVFSLTPPALPGAPWTEAVLYSFRPPPDATFPISDVAIGSGGVLYGTAPSGGADNWGAVFSLTPPATPGAPWTEAVLFSFDGLRSGAEPKAGVSIDPESGALFGTTYGASNIPYGSAYALLPPAISGGPWTPIVLHDFTGGDDEGHSIGRLLIGGPGVLYGTTNGPGGGTAFSLTF